MANSSEYDVSVSNLRKGVSFMKMLKRNSELLFFFLPFDIYIFTEHAGYSGCVNSLLMQCIPADWGTIRDQNLKRKNTSFITLTDL